MNILLSLYRNLPALEVRALLGPRWDRHGTGVDTATSRFLFQVTLWLFNIAMGNGPFIYIYIYIDGLPIKNSEIPWLC